MHLLYIVFITESLHHVFVNNQPLNSLTFESSLFSGLLFLVMVSKGDKQGANENGLMQIYVKQWKLLKEWRSLRKLGHSLVLLTQTHLTVPVISLNYRYFRRGSIFLDLFQNTDCSFVCLTVKLVTSFKRLPRQIKQWKNI